jgi:eukaryotic-like serine/threonine-protein kinase
LRAIDSHHARSEAGIGIAGADVKPLAFALGDFGKTLLSQSPLRNAMPMAARSLDRLQGLSSEDRAEFEDRVEAFEHAWERGERPRIADHLPQRGEIRLPVLVELVQIDRERRAKLGETVPPEVYRREFPELTESLLAGWDVPGTQALPAGAVPIAERPGSRIGNYKLLEQIGEGGFGLVFDAEQERPVRRRVALKIIKPGMDTREVVARFEAERQALALMDHPNIARVIDGGTTESGRPYFVMELVRGIPITDYCDQHHMVLRERLALFVSVCQAVQHAHQKGIVHRDIKPSNVLVMLRDGKPLVKVIDFGIAKALYQPLTEKTIHTQFAQMIGTPLYMSPEQAEMGGLDIDTRSDVYSLGVLLYELLTGTTPFDKKRLARAAYEELLRIVVNEEPPRPSTRLSSLGDTATTVAVNRSLDVKRLSQLLAGDLDWVVMKALEKDRGRRYDSASAFADDVERYLHDEAIVARPPSNAYRLRKFVRRNKASMATATFIAIALLTATAFSAWQALRAIRAAAAEKQAKDEALAREDETNSMLKFVEDRIIKVARPEGEAGGLGRGVTLRKAIESALPFVAQSFPNQPLIEARLRLTLAESFAMLGDARTAAAQDQAALALYTRYRGGNDPQTLRAMFKLVLDYDDLGRFQDALELGEQTLALHTAVLGPDHADTINTMDDLANVYSHLGRLNDALKLREETVIRQKAKHGLDHPDTLSSMHNLAASYEEVGRKQDALKLREETVARLKIVRGPDHPETLTTMCTLATSYNDVGRRAEAVKLYQETLALQKSKLGLDHSDTLWTMSGLARAFRDLGRLDDALKLHQETLVHRRAALGAEHPDTLASMDDVAEIYHLLGQFDQAIKLRRTAFALQKAKLGPSHPNTLVMMGSLASDLLAAHRDAEALTILDDCIQRTTTADPQFLSRWINLRLRLFQQKKDVAGCRQTAEMWEKLKRNDGDSLYVTCCFRAVVSAVLRASDKSAAGARQADSEADLAMQTLREAVAHGYQDAANIHKDDDLDSLRSRDDFKKLVAELDAKKPKAQ